MTMPGLQSGRVNKNSIWKKVVSLSLTHPLSETPGLSMFNTPSV